MTAKIATTISCERESLKTFIGNSKRLFTISKEYFLCNIASGPRILLFLIRTMDLGQNCPEGPIARSGILNPGQNLTRL